VGRRYFTSGSYGWCIFIFVSSQCLWENIYGDRGSSAADGKFLDFMEANNI
jgi:hypothetical protein